MDNVVQIDITGSYTWGSIQKFWSKEDTVKSV